MGPTSDRKGDLHVHIHSEELAMARIEYHRLAALRPGMTLGDYVNYALWRVRTLGVSDECRARVLEVAAERRISPGRALEDAVFAQYGRSPGAEKARRGA